MTRPSAMPLALLLPLTGLLAACGNSGPVKQTVQVTATDTSCDAATTQLSGTGTYAFTVTNKGNQETELYLYDANGHKIEEAEGIGPGTTRTLKAKLGVGTYQLNCKPGEKDKGLTAEIRVSG